MIVEACANFCTKAAIEYPEERPTGCQLVLVPARVPRKPSTTRTTCLQPIRHSKEIVEASTDLYGTAFATL